MADLNALIAQGAQFNLPNPVDQYSKVMQLQAAQQQMQVQRQQMQQIQEDRAGFAKLRETLAQQNLTPEQYEAALTQSPDPSHQKMGVEMRFRRSRLAELEKAMGGAEPVSAPSAMPAPTEMPAAKTFDTSAAMVAPVQKPYSEMSNREKILYNEWTGRGRQSQPSTAVYTVDGQVAPFGDYVNANIANSAGAGERAAMAAMPNALAARVAPAVAAAPVANAMVAQAPVANAMSTKQAQLADISKKLAVLTKPQFSDVAGVKDQIAYLRDEQKRLSESPLAKIDPKDYDPDSFAAYMQTGDATKLRKITDQRLAFDQAKFEWEKANPGKTIKEINQGGVTKYFAINDRTNEATPVTIAGGKVLTGTDMASQRLAFDQAKFAWEKSNPGFTIQQTEDGSIVGVNNRTLQAYPVTLNAGGPPSAAPFTGIGGTAPSAGAGRGAVGVTDGRMAPIAPVAAPAGMPLKGKSAGLTESQGNATAFGMRMKDSHAVLKELENKGVSNTGVVGGTTGAVVGLVPLIGDKLTSGVDNIYNVLPEVLGGYSPEQQQVLNGRINFISAVLRKESGASIQPSEFSMMEKLYFPRPGDLPPVIKQKQDARELAIKAMKVQAGPGAKSIENLGVGTSSESDPLGIRK
jgi:DNA-binding protein H-NS